MNLPDRYSFWASLRKPLVACCDLVRGDAVENGARPLGIDCLFSGVRRHCSDLLAIADMVRVVALAGDMVEVLLGMVRSEIFSMLGAGVDGR